jgi:YfiH family protein
MSAACQTATQAPPWRSGLLATIPGIGHALTRRVVGMGAADGNVGFSAPRDRADAWLMRQQWCALAGFRANRLVTLGQIHGSAVHRVFAGDAGRGAAPGSPQIGLGDALATDIAGPVLMTLHADCQPIFLVDPGRQGHGPAVAVVHAGWRGTVADVVGATLAAMQAAYGTHPGDVHAALGPAIQSCCYGVGEEVAAAWRNRAGGDASAALKNERDRIGFSIAAANAILLDRAGVPAANVEISLICTRCDGEHWFSHRGQGADTGRFGAMIAIAGHGAPE